MLHSPHWLQQHRQLHKTFGAIRRVLEVSEWREVGKDGKILEQLEERLVHRRQTLHDRIGKELAESSSKRKQAVVEAGA